MEPTTNWDLIIKNKLEQLDLPYQESSWEQMNTFLDSDAKFEAQARQKLSELDILPFEFGDIQTRLTAFKAIRSKILRIKVVEACCVLIILLILSQNSNRTTYADSTFLKETTAFSPLDIEHQTYQTLNLSEGSIATNKVEADHLNPTTDNSTNTSSTAIGQSTEKRTSLSTSTISIAQSSNNASKGLKTSLAAPISLLTAHPIANIPAKSITIPHNELLGNQPIAALPVPNRPLSQQAYDIDIKPVRPHNGLVIGLEGGGGMYSFHSPEQLIQNTTVQPDGSSFSFASAITAGYIREKIEIISGFEYEMVQFSPQPIVEIHQGNPYIGYVGEGITDIDIEVLSVPLKANVTFYKHNNLKFGLLIGGSASAITNTSTTYNSYFIPGEYQETLAQNYLDGRTAHTDVSATHNILTKIFFQSQIGTSITYEFDPSKYIYLNIVKQNTQEDFHFGPYNTTMSAWRFQLGAKTRI